MANKKILIVDDDRDLARMLNIRLKASGYETLVAQDAISAVSQARTEKPDLVLLDLGLPGGDGYTVMDRLQNLPATTVIPVIVISAQPLHLNEQKSLKAGALAFFSKPIDNEGLIAAIRKALGEPAENK